MIKVHYYCLRFVNVLLFYNILVLCLDFEYMYMQLNVTIYCYLDGGVSCGVEALLSEPF